jgi:hypothetical protein
MSNRDKEEKIVELLKPDVGTVQKVVELLELRREKHKNSLEDREDPLQRGRSQECRDLIKLFTQ